MTERLDLVFIGLTLSSSWGNGHATTYRGLLRGLHALGHELLFLERDVEWYRSHRDLPAPDFCSIGYYDSVGELIDRHAEHLRRADAVIVGSYVPEGMAAIDAVAACGPRQLLFYDIDTPVTLANLVAGREEYLGRRQIPLFDDYLSFTGGPTLERLETEFGARRADELFCSVDADRYRPTGEPLEWDLGYLGTYSPDRQSTLEELLLEPARRLPQLRFVVAGPQFPADIAWPENVERIEHLPPGEHAGFYSRQRFTLNVTRADMVAAGWSPSVRLFEAAACATPIISDAWRGLDDLLPEGEALLIAHSSEDVVAALTGTSERQRKSIGATARARILAQHTGLARARQLVGIIEELPERSTVRAAIGGRGKRHKRTLEEGAIGR